MSRYELFLRVVSRTTQKEDAIGRALKVQAMAFAALIPAGDHWL